MLQQSSRRGIPGSGKVMASSSAVADLGKRLLEASRKGNAEEVRQLMATGAPITTDWLGTSPLHLAAQYGHTVTAEVLLRAGVSRDGKTKVDKTPLHLAAQHGHLEIAKMLIKSGATVNQVDMLNMTPLHWAVEAHSPEICKLLMKNGATTDTRNKFGQSAMDIIKAKNYHNLTEILLCTNQGANDYINERQNNNNTNIYFESRKRARTRKFPMTAGSWTGGELQTDKDSRPRPKQARLIVEEKQPTTNINENLEERESVANGNNLSSLVDAAALVRSKAHNNISNNRISGSISGDTSQRNIPVFTDASVLDTLATLATASTQIITSGSDTIGSTGTKTASQPNSSLRPSYVTIPGIQAPVQILQANPNQPGLVTPSPVASALPAGMIQLASPLAFNIMPGGRLQVGQPVVSGAHLNIPVQMPLQTAGLPAGHFIAVNNSSNTIISQPAGTLGQSVAKQPVATETLSSRPTSIMSAATQGATAELPQGNLPVNLPIGLVNTLVGGNVSLANIQPLPGNTSTAQSGDARFIQPKAVPVTQISLQPGMAPAQLAQAIQYANIGPGLAPIPFLPVAGLGGLQFLPQVIPTQLFNALRGSLPQAPQFHPQLANNAYTIPMSPLNLSSILPTAASLAQLPLAQQQSLAQHLQIPATPQVHSSVAQLLQPSPNQQQTIASSTPQPLNVVTQRILESPPHQQIVTLPAQGHGSIAQQLQPSANQQQPAASTQLSLNVVTQRIIEPPSQQQIVTLAPQIDGPLHQQTTSNHQDSGTLSQRVLGTQAQIVLGPGHLTQRVLGSPTQEPTVSQQMVSLGQEVQDVFGPTRSDTLEHRIHSSPTQQPIVSQIVSLGQEVQDVFGSTRSDTLEQRVHGSPTQQTVVSQPMVSLDQEVQDVLGPTRPDILEQRVVGSPTQQLNISLGQEDRNSINQSSNFVQHVSPTQQETVSFGNEAKAAVNHTQPGSLTERVLPSSIQQQLISSGQEAQSRPDSLAQRLLGSSPSDHTVSSGPEVQSLLDESRSGPLAQHVLGSSSPEQTVSLGQEIQRTLNETRPCSFGEDVLSSTTEHQMVSIGQEVESTLVQSQSDGLARGVLPSPTQQPTFTSEQDVQDPLNQTRNGNIDQYALGSPAQDVQSTLNQSDTFSRHMLTSSTQQPETSLQQEIQDPLNRPQTDTFDQHVLGSPAQDIQSTLNQSDTLSRRIHATSTQQPEISLQQDPQNPLLQPQCNTFDQRALGSPAQDVQITLAEASTLAQSVFCSASESPIVTLAQNMITSSMQPESDVTAKQTLNSSTENFGDSPNTQAFIDTFAQPPTSEQHVTSTIDPELSLSPANFADSEDKMMVPEDQTAGIVVSSDAIQSANDNNSLPVSQPEESPSSTSDSGSQVLPHLQQLVYKQLQDQTQVAESPNTALKDQLSTIEAEDDSNKDENRPKTRISQEITEEGSESTDEQTRRHASEDGQQVDLLRFLEPSTTTEEHPQEDLGDLKTQSNEEVNQLETQNEKDELKTTEEEIVLNEEELCEAGNPPTDALKQADDEQI